MQILVLLPQSHNGFTYLQYYYLNLNYQFLVLNQSLILIWYNWILSLIVWLTELSWWISAIDKHLHFLVFIITKCCFLGTTILPADILLTVDLQMYVNYHVHALLHAMFRLLLNIYKAAFSVVSNYTVQFLLNSW